MSSGWMVFAELALVFGAVFGFGFYELHKLKQYQRKKLNSQANTDNNKQQQSRP